MISSTELKNGTTFLSEGKPYKVIKYSHIKIARGGATVRVTARNLESGGVEDKTYNSNVKVEDINTQKKRLQFLYVDQNMALFIDPTTYDQVEIATSVVKNELPFIKEGEKVDVLYWEDKALSVDIPPKVTLEVVETDPGVKGNSASNVYKSAILENGLSVKVPLFIEKGDGVRVDTRTSEYVERAK